MNTKHPILLWVLTTCLVLSVFFCIATVIQLEKGLTNGVWVALSMSITAIFGFLVWSYIEGPPPSPPWERDFHRLKDHKGFDPKKRKEL